MISLQIDIQNRENENPNANVEQWDLISIALNVAFPIYLFLEPQILSFSWTSNFLSFSLSLTFLSISLSTKMKEWQKDLPPP